MAMGAICRQPVLKACARATARLSAPLRALRKHASPNMRAAKRNVTPIRAKIRSTKKGPILRRPRTGRVRRERSRAAMGALCAGAPAGRFADLVEQPLFDAALLGLVDAQHVPQIIVHVAVLLADHA